MTYTGLYNLYHEIYYKPKFRQTHKKATIEQIEQILK